MLSEISIDFLKEFNFPNDAILSLQSSNITSLRPLQYNSLKKGLLKGKSFFISSPSGAGKTLIGELAAIYTIHTYKKKSIYLVPLRALATEKCAYFIQKYQNLGLNIYSSIGDQEISVELLKSTDLLIMTYEKFDSYIRSLKENSWINEIKTVIIDEIHILGSRERGPRLENLILRIYRLSNPPQIISLSATVANSNDINGWFSYLELKYRKRYFECIIENERPVELKYMVLNSKNKIDSICSIAMRILNDSGQVLVFTNSRMDCKRIYEELKNKINIRYDVTLFEIKKILKDIAGNINEIAVELMQSFYSGISFHHAGLNSSERLLIETLFKKGIIKILCTTNTLSSGVNTPARAVILKEFIIFKPKITKTQHNSPHKKRYSKLPMNNNLFHQICGRAGRPGYDSVGYAFILANNIEEQIWIEDNYFQTKPNENLLIPKFDYVYSKLIKNWDILEEIILLSVYETSKFDSDILINLIQDSFMWYQLKEKKIPIEAYLNLYNLNYLSILKTMSNKELINALKFFIVRIKIIEFKLDKKLIVNIKLHPTNSFKSKITSIDKQITKNKREMYLHSLNKILNKQDYTCKISISKELGIICNCNFCMNYQKSILNHISAIKKKIFPFCVYKTALIDFFKKFEEDNNIKNNKKVKYYIDFQNFKPLVIKNSDKLEKFFYNSIFPDPIIKKLIQYQLIEKQNSKYDFYNITPLGEIGLQNFLLPNIIHELDELLKNFCKEMKAINFENIFPIIRKLLVKLNVKSFPSLKEAMILWINEVSIEKIFEKIENQTLYSKIYFNDFYNIVDSSLRIINFIHDYLKKFAPHIDERKISVLFYRMKYGIKTNLIDIAKLYKNEDPKSFRKKIKPIRLYCT